MKNVSHANFNLVHEQNKFDPEPKKRNVTPACLFQFTVKSVQEEIAGNVNIPFLIELCAKILSKMVEKKCAVESVSPSRVLHWGVHTSCYCSSWAP